MKRDTKVRYTGTEPMTAIGFKDLMLEAPVEPGAEGFILSVGRCSTCIEQRHKGDPVQHVLIPGSPDLEAVIPERQLEVIE